MFQPHLRFVSLAPTLGRNFIVLGGAVAVLGVAVGGFALFAAARWPSIPNVGLIGGVFIVAGVLLAGMGGVIAREHARAASQASDPQPSKGSGKSPPENG
jgi:hypothetical protein